VACPVLLNELDLSAQGNSYISKSELRRFPDILREYRSLEILLKEFCEIYCIIYIPSQFLVGNCILYCNYALFNYWADLLNSSKLLIFLIELDVMLVWGAVLEFAGRIHFKGCRTLRSWKALKLGRDGKYCSKFRKRCRPLNCGTSYFRVRRLAVLRFLRGIITGTFRVMLAL